MLAWKQFDGKSPRSTVLRDGGRTWPDMELACTQGASDQLGHRIGNRPEVNEKNALGLGGRGAFQKKYKD
jgi:hypothetical protein